MLYLTERELEYVHNNLLALRVYRDTDIPHGVVLWESWHEVFLHKIEDAIESSKLGAQLREN